MLKILIAGKYKPNGHNPIGGLQSWIRTIKKELERLGHEVYLWQQGDGIAKSERFDLGILSNIEITNHLRALCNKTTLISHGIIPAEKPDNSCDKLLFVSEGVRDHWKMKGGIIRQPIDLDFWKPKNNVKSLVSRFSYRQGETHCQSVAAAMGMTYAHIKNHTPENARKFIRQSAVVFATGRAALESMACGVPVVIYDHRKAYQEPLMGTSYLQQMNHSYSGRGGITPTKEQLQERVEHCIKAGSKRNWIKYHHDSKKIVKELIK